MKKTYKTMTFAEKAVHHVHWAEHYQQKAEQLERIASECRNDQQAAYMLNHSETMAFPYKQVTGNRNGHQQRAIMYGIVALLEKLST